MDKFAIFLLSSEEFGIELKRVVEILRRQKFTTLPRLPDFIVGVINLRGDVIPVVDMRRRFGLTPSPLKERIIIVKADRENVGLLVDGVKEIITLQGDHIVTPPRMFKGLKAEYLSGIGKEGDRLIILLNIDTLLTAEEKILLEEIKGKGVSAEMRNEKF